MKKSFVESKKTNLDKKKLLSLKKTIERLKKIDDNESLNNYSNKLYRVLIRKMK